MLGLSHSLAEGSLAESKLGPTSALSLVLLSVLLLLLLANRRAVLSVVPSSSDI